MPRDIMLVLKLSLCYTLCCTLVMSSLPVAVLDTIDYVDPSGRCVFRTTAVEKDRLVFQMVRRPPFFGVVTVVM